MGDAAALETMTELLHEAIRNASSAGGRAISARPQESISGSFRVKRRETRPPEMLLEAERTLSADAQSDLSHHSGSGYERYLIDEERYVSRMPETFDISYRILRTGDLVWVGVGGEVFTAFGISLADCADAVDILPVGITGISKGYLPPEPAFSQGGYEVAAARWCPIAPGETEKLFSQIEAQVRAVAGTESR
jgi:hypothetical protein